MWRCTASTVMKLNTAQCNIRYRTTPWVPNKSTVLRHKIGMVFHRLHRSWFCCRNKAYFFFTASVYTTSFNKLKPGHNNNNKQRIALTQVTECRSFCKTKTQCTKHTKCLPWYNHPGWLGVKNQFSTVCIPESNMHTHTHAHTHTSQQWTNVQTANGKTEVVFVVFTIIWLWKLVTVT